MTRILTGTANAVNGSATVTVVGLVLSAINCPVDSQIVLGGATYFVASVTDTTHVVLTRVYAGTTAAVSCEITALTAAEIQTATLNARLATLISQMSILDANARGPFYTFDSTTTDSDPGAGKVRLNNATMASVTAAYLDNNDANGNPISSLIDTWDDSTNTVKGELVIYDVSDATKFAAFNVTGSVVDGTGYRKLTLVYVAAGTVLDNGSSVSVAFFRSGDKGATGAAGTNGTNGTNGVFSAIASQAEADAGTENTKGMTALRVAQALADNAFFKRANILGTVSQTSGVPTGAIIERGSNANGEYARYADGTLICWMSYSLDFTSYSSLLSSGVYAQALTFPATFLVGSRIIGEISMLQAGYNATANAFCSGCQVNCDVSAANVYRVVNTDLVNSAVTRTIVVSAQGRWF